MNTNASNKSIPTADIGISAIETYQPAWVLPNAWYASTIKRKFVKHTGITARAIAVEDEVALAAKCVKQLASDPRMDLANCAALLFVSPSVLPMKVANRYLDRSQARAEQPNRLAGRLAGELGLQPRRILGINGFCSGYAKAMTLVMKQLPNLKLERDEFILVITSSRISRITDYACDQSGALFGDFATATLLSRNDSVRYPVHFEVLNASFEKQPVARPFFDFSLRRDVLVPTPDGGQAKLPERIVFSLDGMGIADSAPRAMARAATELSTTVGISPHDFQFVVPHQAGTAIVRLTGMKLEEAGFTGHMINGLTEEIGNISSGSVPYALKQYWNQLKGNILCPVAAVGAPGKPEISQGCIVLRAARRRHAVAA